jgi:hypothetical protein
LFERPHHQRIAAVLQRIDAGLLRSHDCLFGGGTAIALARGEYRESVDIDFICSTIAGYRAMRELTSKSGIDWAFAQPVTLVRAAKADQYGIRCAVALDHGTPIKIEIVYEGRVRLDPPLPEDRICGIWVCTRVDLAATKLMANADRWVDDSVMGRDLIDLAMLAESGVVPAAGVDKARRAYGSSIDEAFEKARRALQARPGRLAVCMTNMGMRMPESLLMERIAGLSLASH